MADDRELLSPEARRAVRSADLARRAHPVAQARWLGVRRDQDLDGAAAVLDDDPAAGGVEEGRLRAHGPLDRHGPTLGQGGAGDRDDDGRSAGWRSLRRSGGWGSGRRSGAIACDRRPGDGDVRGVAEPDPVAVEAPLARGSLAGDPDEPVPGARAETRRVDAARRVGHDPDFAVLRVGDTKRQVAARRPNRTRDEGPGEDHEASLDRFAQRRRIDGGRSRDGPRAADHQARGGEANLELAVRLGEHATHDDDAFPVAAPTLSSFSLTAIPPVASPIANSVGVPRRPASADTTPVTVTTDPTARARAVATSVAAAGGADGDGAGEGDGRADGAGDGLR